MIETKNITENDIFNYVYFNKRLSEADKKLIESNEENFELIRFYKEQKAELNKSLKDETKMKLASRISAYKFKSN